MSDKPSGLEPGEVHELVDLTTTVPDGIVSRTLLKNEAGNITVFAFGRGQGLTTHTSPYDAFVQVLDGAGRFTVGDESHSVAAGQCILMPANVPHAVHAEEDFKMVLVMLRG